MDTSSSSTEGGLEMMKKQPATPSAVEQVLGCGSFQGLAFLCYQWVVMVQAWNTVFMAFGKVVPTKWTFGNGTEASCECLQSAEGCGNFTWVADFYSIVPHWQLVCDRVKIVYFIMTVQVVGVFVGSPIFGQISDTCGRKWTLFGTTAALILFGSLSAFSSSWQVFAGLRFLVGLSCGGTTTTAYVLLMEMVNRRHRLWMSSIAGWPVAFAMMSLLAYVTADWRVLAMVTNLAGLPALALILFVGESPRWLLQHGKGPQAESQLRRIVRMNRHEVDEKQLLGLLDEAASRTEVSARLLEESRSLKGDQGDHALTKNGPRKYTYWHLFSTRTMAVHTIVFAICYFCTSNVSNGVIFTADKLSGNLYLNFFLLACLRWLSNAMTIVADLFVKCFGRKIGFVSPFVLIAVTSMTIVALSITGYGHSSLHTVTSAMSLVIAMLCAPIWVMLSLAASETYPTPIRNIAAAFCATFNRLGGVVVPQFLYLGHFWTPSPYVVFGVLSSLAALLFAIFIPETKGMPLPDTMPVRRDPKEAARPVKVLVVNKEEK